MYGIPHLAGTSSDEEVGQKSCLELARGATVSKWQRQAAHVYRHLLSSRTI